jgi:hypothetical protein
MALSSAHNHRFDVALRLYHPVQLTGAPPERPAPRAGLRGLVAGASTTPELVRGSPSAVTTWARV